MVSVLALYKIIRTRIPLKSSFLANPKTSLPIFHCDKMVKKLFKILLSLASFLVFYFSCSPLYS